MNFLVSGVTAEVVSGLNQLETFSFCAEFISTTAFTVNASLFEQKARTGVFHRVQMVF